MAARPCSRVQSKLLLASLKNGRIVCQLKKNLIPLYCLVRNLINIDIFSFLFSSLNFSYYASIINFTMLGQREVSVCDLQFVVLDILSDVETSGGLVGFSTVKR